MRIVDRIGAANQFNKPYFTGVKVIMIGGRIRSGDLVGIGGADGERADVIVVYGSINQPNGGGIVVDCFDIVFYRVFKMEEGDIALAGEFEFGMAAVAGVGLEAERVADIANSATCGRNALLCTSGMEEME